MKRREQAGFSLVELLIGLMLTALILQAIPPLLSTSFLSWRQSVARTATHQSARMAMEAMTRELRLASEVVSPLPGQAAASVSVDAPDETGRTTRLTFRLGTNHGCQIGARCGTAAGGRGFAGRFERARFGRFLGRCLYGFCGCRPRLC